MKELDNGKEIEVTDTDVIQAPCRHPHQAGPDDEAQDLWAQARPHQRR
jgi:hypothetical protein